MQAQEEVAMVEVDRKLFKELQEFGFSQARAAWALHHCGNSSIEAAINWIIDHDNDSDIDKMPLVAVNIDIESLESSDVTDAMKVNAKELRDQAGKKKQQVEKMHEIDGEKERIRAGKELFEAKRIAEDNKRKHHLALKKVEQEDDRRARSKVLQKLEADKLERRPRLGLRSEELEIPVTKSLPSWLHERRISSPVMSVKKAEKMTECLRSIRRDHRDNDARVKRALQTLLVYIGNVANNPDEEKFRKIRLSNPIFHDRIGDTRGGIEFLELCGFERIEENEFLYLPRDKVNVAALYMAAIQLKSAMTNPFLGLLSKASQY